MGKIWFDKWVHIGLFMIMVILWNRTFSEKNHKKLFRTIAILSILYGIIMELVQQFFIPFRSFEITDIAADTIGSFAGYLISMKWYIKNKPL